MKTINLTKISFPDIQLNVRDAHKLRGYFGSVFQEYSPLLHNHYDNGTYRQRYPLVQYKVIDGTPTLIALEEGAELLTRLFLKMDQLEINGESYPILSKNIQAQKYDIGYSDELVEYQFKTLWMSLNQENYKSYVKLNAEEKKKKLNKILIGHILSFYKEMGLFLDSDERLMAKTSVTEKSTKFKDQRMVAFSGSFVVNASLPNAIGLGKSVARGFGTVSKSF